MPKQGGEIPNLRFGRGRDIVRRIFSISAILLMTLVFSAAALDNTLKEGAGKVEGGFKEAGKSAVEIGTKAGKAAEGAAKDTGSALGRAWDNIVRGLKKAFK